MEMSILMMNLKREYLMVHNQQKRGTIKLKQALKISEFVRIRPSISSILMRILLIMTVKLTP